MAEAIKERRVWVGFWPTLAAMALFSMEMSALCFPTLINRGPLLFIDSRSYYLGGHAALDKAISMFARHSGATTEDVVQAARGVRSVFYSLFTYVPASVVSLGFVVVLQATIVLCLLRQVFNLACSGRPRWQASLFIMTLALTSTLSWTASMVMPDIFASILALSVIVSIVYWDRVSLPTRWTLLGCIAGSVVMHLTNLPMAIGLLAVAAVIRSRQLWFERTRFVLIGGALATGALAMLAVGVVGFHQWSMAPQAPPFLLARSIQDGPGRLYLQDHCPQVGLAMCRHLDRIDPASTDDFIWHSNGVYSTVSAQERAELRAEEKRIYVAAALEHPWMQAGAIVQNAVHQLFLFNFREYIIPSSAEYASAEMVIEADDPAITKPLWQVIAAIPIYVVVFGSLWHAARAWRRGWLDRDQKQLFVFVIATVLIEAAAGAFSEPAPRYEARVIWLIPMLALLFSYRQAEGTVKRPWSPVLQPEGLL